MSHDIALHTAGSVDRQHPGAFRAGFMKGRPLEWDFLRIAIFAYILVGVARIHQYFSFLKPLHPALLTFFLICAYVVIRPSSIDLSNVFKTWPGRAIIVLGVCAIASVVFGISLGNSAKFILQDYASVLIFAVIMVSSLMTVNHLKTAILGFVVSGAFWLYLSFFVLGTESIAGGISRLDVRYTYDSNDFCVILTSAMPLGLLFFRTGHSKWLRRAGLGVLLGVPAAVAMSGSRGGFLGLMVVSAALLLIVKEISALKKIGGVFIAIIALMAAAPPGYWDQMRTMLEPEQDYNWTSPTGRRQILIRGAGYMVRFPIFGLGVDNFPRAEGTIGDMARYHVAGTGLRYVAPHNTLLQVGAEMGIPALIVWLSVIGTGIVYLLKIGRRLNPDSGDPDERFLFFVCRYLPVSWWAFLTTTFFVSFAYLVPFYILLAYTSGTILMVRRFLAYGSVSGNGAAAAVPAPAGPTSEWRSRRAVPAATVWGFDNAPRGSAAFQPRRGLQQEG